MKNKMLFAVASLASVLFFSCQNDDSITDENLVKTKAYTVSTDETSDLVKTINNRVNETLNEISDGEILEMFDAAEIIVSGETELSGEQTPLEDVFYVYEGLFNNQFGNYLAEVVVLETVEKEISLPVEVGDDGAYFVNNAVLSEFYNNLADEISEEFIDTPEKILYLCDFRLKELDEEGDFVIIRAGVSIGVPIPVQIQYLSPGSPYYACGLLGTCATNYNQGVLDAASFINISANTSVSTCPPGTSLTLSYPMIGVRYSTYSRNTWPVPNEYNTEVWPYFWSDNYNACLGNNNQEWQNLYFDFKKIRDYAVHTTQQDLGYTNFKFLAIDYHSEIYQTVNTSFYHEGEMLLGRLVCRQL